MNSSASVLVELGLPRDTGYLGNAISEIHVTRVAASFVFFYFCNYVFEHFIVPSMLVMSNLKREVKVRDISVQIGSMVHAVGSAVGSLYVLLYPDESVAEDKLHGFSDSANAVFALSLGYFIFDLFFVVLKAEKIEWPFVLHHGGALAVYTTCSVSFMAWYGLACLLYEFSTPFLCMRSIMLSLGMKGSQILGHIEKVFALTFVLCRILWGIPVSLHGIVNASVAAYNDEVPYLIHFVTLLSINIALNALNVLWLSKIIRMASGAKKAKSQ